MFMSGICKCAPSKEREREREAVNSCVRRSTTVRRPVGVSLSELGAIYIATLPHSHSFGPVPLKQCQLAIAAVHEKSHSVKEIRRHWADQSRAQTHRAERKDSLESKQADTAAAAAATTTYHQNLICLIELVNYNRNSAAVNLVS